MKSSGLRRMIQFHFALILLLLAAAAAAQVQKAPTTDPTEEAALNAVLDRLPEAAPRPRWNTTSDLCSGAAADNRIDLYGDPSSKLAIECDCSDQNNTVCHITRLKISDVNMAGNIPEELRNLTRLTHLNLSKNLLTGSIPLFIGELTSMQYM
uniref:Leucine-rich repeat-containing N-terminal plant-type domain-containing protein n=1 Tax=Oryza brachyantha TaxID=4533 RepID=J3M1F6_ORYBR